MQIFANNPAANLCASRWEIFPFLHPTQHVNCSSQVGVNMYDLPVSAHDTGVELRGRLGQGTIFAKGKFKEIWFDYSAQKIALQHCGFHVFLWIFFDCGEDSPPGNDAETPWSSSVLVRAAALKNSAEMLELDFKETPGGEPKEAKETTKQWPFGPSSVTHYTYYMYIYILVYIIMTLWGGMKCRFEVQTSELVDLLILPNLKLRRCGRDCGTALGLWTCADVLPKALHTSAGTGLGGDRMVTGWWMMEVQTPDRPGWFGARRRSTTLQWSMLCFRTLGVGCYTLGISWDLDLYAVIFFSW